MFLTQSRGLALGKVDCVDVVQSRKGRMNPPGSGSTSYPDCDPAARASGNLRGPWSAYLSWRTGSWTLRTLPDEMSTATASTRRVSSMPGKASAKGRPLTYSHASSSKSTRLPAALTCVWICSGSGRDELVRVGRRETTHQEWLPVEDGAPHRVWSCIR